MKYYLGLDMGTTGVKAAVFSPDGIMAGSGLAEYTLETPAPDIVELDTEQYWISAKKSDRRSSRRGEDPAGADPFDRGHGSGGNPDFH